MKKKIISIMSAASLMLALVACGNSDSQTASETKPAQTSETVSTEPEDKKTTKQSEIASSDSESETEDKVLVVYFSAGNRKDADAISSATPYVEDMAATEYVAQLIHDSVGGELAKIMPETDYPVGYNDVADKAKSEQDKDLRPQFTLEVNPEEYDTIFIGYPIWWYHLPMIMDTFFEAYDLNGKTIIPFNTHAGSRDGGTYIDIEKLEPDATVLDGFNISGGTGSKETETAVSKWLNNLGY